MATFDDFAPETVASFDTFVSGLHNAESTYGTAKGIDTPNKAKAVWDLQVTPIAAQDVGADYEKVVADREYAWDTGKKYAKKMWDMFQGEPSLAAAAYTAGPTAVRRWATEAKNLGVDVREYVQNRLGPNAKAHNQKVLSAFGDNGAGYKSEFASYDPDTGTFSSRDPEAPRGAVPPRRAATFDDFDADTGFRDVPPGFNEESIKATFHNTLTALKNVGGTVGVLGDMLLGFPAMIAGHAGGLGVAIRGAVEGEDRKAVWQGYKEGMDFFKGPEWINSPIGSLYKLLGKKEIYEESAGAKVLEKVTSAIQDAGTFIEKKTDSSIPSEAIEAITNQLMISMGAPGVRLAKRLKDRVPPAVEGETGGARRPGSRQQDISDAEIVPPQRALPPPGQPKTFSDFEIQSDPAKADEFIKQTLAENEKVDAEAAKKRRLATLALGAAGPAGMGAAYLYNKLTSPGNNVIDRGTEVPEPKEGNELAMNQIGSFLSEGDSRWKELAPLLLAAGWVKAKGGMWHPEAVERLSQSIYARLTQDIGVGYKDVLKGFGKEDSELPLAKWVQSRVSNYLNKYAGTKEDPLKDVEIPLGQGTARWETVTDDAIRGRTKEHLELDNKLRDPSGYHDKHPDVAVAQSLRPGETVWELPSKSSHDPQNALTSYLSHVGDYLRQNVLKDTDPFAWMGRQPEKIQKEIQALTKDWEAKNPNGNGTQAMSDIIEARKDYKRDLDPLAQYDLVRAVKETAANDARVAKEAMKEALKGQEWKAEQQSFMPEYKSYPAQKLPERTLRIGKGGGIGLSNMQPFKLPAETLDLSWRELKLPEKLTPEQAKFVRKLEGKDREDFHRMGQGNAGHDIPRSADVYEAVDSKGKLIVDNFTGEPARGATPEEAWLSGQLATEGNTLAHCVGGYCEGVASGDSRIFSLRDAKGRSHATVEVVPENLRLQSPIDWYHQGASEAFQQKYPRPTNDLNNAGKRWGQTVGSSPEYEAYIQAEKSRPLGQNISQIKGPGNAAPQAEYLPYVQDFVKSGPLEPTEVGYRGKGSGGTGNSEGNGIYIANSEEFGSRFSKHGVAKRFEYDKPKNPLNVGRELPLMEQEEVFNSIKKSDSLWMKINKEAMQEASADLDKKYGKDFKNVPNNKLGEVTGELYDLAGDKLTEKLLDRGYDAVQVDKGDPEGWTVLLRRKGEFKPPRTNRQWGEVGDLGNTGLRRIDKTTVTHYEDGFPQKGYEGIGLPDGYYTQAEIDAALAKHKGPRNQRGYADPRLLKAIALAGIGALTGAALLPDDKLAAAIVGGILALGLGHTKISELPKLISKDSKLARTAERSIKASTEQFIRAVNPDLLGKQAESAASVLGKNYTEMMQRQLAIEIPSSKRAEFWIRMGKDKGRAFLKAMEKGATFSDPTLQSYALAYRAWMNKIFKQDELAGIKYEPVDNYIYHAFEDPKGAAAYFSKKYGPKWGDPTFTKDRTFDLIEEAEKAGFRLKVENPESLMVMRQHASDIAAMKTQALRDLVEYGLARRIEKGKPALAGEFTWRSPNGELYALPDLVNQVFHNAFSTRSLWADPGVGGQIFRGLSYAKNALIPIQLFSLFHPLHVQLGMSFADPLVAMTKRVAAGTASFSDFMKEALTKATLTDIISTPRSGWRVLQAFRDPMSASKLSVPDKQSLNLMLEGTFNPTMPVEYRNQHMRDFRHSLLELDTAIREGKIVGSAAGLAKVPWNLIFATFEKFYTKPIFEQWIPAVKTAAYLRGAYAALEANPALINSPLERMNALRKISKMVDDRFGEVQYKTLFMNRMLKDVAVASFLSYGWQLGFVRSYLGAVPEATAAAQRIASGKATLRDSIAKGELDKTMFVGYYLMGTMMYAGLLTYALTGDRPKDIMDYIYPRTGEKNPNGSAARISTPFYTREFISIPKHMQEEGIMKGLGITIANKLSPALGMLKAMVTNKDFFNREISNPNAPLMENLGQRLGYAMHSVTPIPLESTKGKGTRDQALGWLGFSPAPKYITDSPVEQKIKHEYGKYHQSTVPYQQARKIEMRSELYQLKQAGKDDAFEAKLQEMKDKYNMSKGEETRLRHNAEIPTAERLFRQLPNHQQEKLLREMSAREQERFRPYANKELRYQ